MVTLKSIAESAGVSVSLVSAVINNSPYVRMTEATRQKVLDIIEESGYVPNHSAVSLKSSRTHMLAVIIPRISDPIFEGLLAGIYAGAEKHGYIVMLGDAGQLVSGSKLLERLVGRGQVDGTLIRHSATLNNDVLHELAKRKAPVVLMDRSEATGMPWVALDEKGGAALAAEHLLSLGHREIGFFGGEQDYPGTQRRIEGVREALAAAGLELPDRFVRFGSQEPQAAYALMQQYLTAGRLPTALVVNNATTATGVLAAVTDAGLSVPDDLSIVAYLDFPGASIVRPAITTVDQPLYELGYQSVELFERFRRGEEVTSYTISSPRPQLVERASARRIGPSLLVS